MPLGFAVLSSCFAEQMRKLFLTRQCYRQEPPVTNYWSFSNQIDFSFNIQQVVYNEKSHEEMHVENVLIAITSGHLELDTVFFFFFK